jgi:hypothetical protein
MECLRAASHRPGFVEDHDDACFIVKDANGFAVAYVYYEEEPGRGIAANQMPREKPGASQSTSPNCLTC